MLPWLIPTFLVGLLPALLLGHLVTLLNRLFPTFLRRLLPALRLRHIYTNLTRNRDAGLLGHLVTSLVGHLLALGVGHRGANIMGRCPTSGIGHLLAVLHWQVLTLLRRHLLADLVAGTLLEWNMFAHFFSLDMRLVVVMLGCLLVRLFLQSNLLGGEAKGKTSAKTKFLADVPSNDCTSESRKKTKRTFLPNATICLNDFYALFRFANRFSNRFSMRFAIAIRFAIRFSIRFAIRFAKRFPNIFYILTTHIF